MRYEGEAALYCRGRAQEKIATEYASAYISILYAIPYRARRLVSLPAFQGADRRF